jgi:hypothetical protein
MMSEPLGTASKPDYNTIPVQLSEEEFEKFILPHLSLPKRGPRCKLGYHKPFNSETCNQILSKIQTRAAPRGAS